MAGMTDTPPEIPAAFNGSANGSPAPAQQTAQGVSEIAGMLPQLPDAMAMVLRQVLQQVQVLTRQHLCAVCVAARKGWQAAHERELKAAAAAAGQAAGLPDGDPRAGQLDPAPFLPVHLRPGAGAEGMPPLTAALTSVSGTEVCSAHVAGPPGGKQLILASTAFSPSMLAGLG